MASRRVGFSLEEVEAIRHAAARAGLSQSDFVHRCVVRTLKPGYAFTPEEDHRIMEAARALGTSKAELIVRAVMHACDEIEALSREQEGYGWREPISPFRERGATVGPP